MAGEFWLAAINYTHLWILSYIQLAIDFCLSSRSGDHSNSYPYHHEAATLMMGPPPPPSESEHAYASVHGLSNYEDLRPAAVPSSSLIRHPHDLRNNRFQRIEMV